LKACNALERIFPELDQLFGIPQPPQHHPEIDCGIHSLLSLEQAAQLSPKPTVRFAALVHDLGKGITPRELWPHHYGHEIKGLPLLTALCQRLRVPNEYRNLAQQVMRYHTHCHTAFSLKPATLIDTLTALNAFKPHHDIADFLWACEADSKGRTGFETHAYPQADYINKIIQLAKKIDITPIIDSPRRGTQIAEAIRKLRIEAIIPIVKEQKSSD
jgi:tRNA nucleotidyltransferase (CCA-adding enzyme)